MVLAEWRFYNRLFDWMLSNCINLLPPKDQTSSKAAT